MSFLSTERPIIKVGLLPKVVREGGVVVFKTQVDGDQKPDILWTKDGKPLTSSTNVIIYEEEETKFLKLLNVDLNDAGNYGLVASNTVGESETKSTLDVYGKHKKIFSSFLFSELILFFGKKQKTFLP